MSENVSQLMGKSANFGGFAVLRHCIIKLPEKLSTFDYIINLEHFVLCICVKLSKSHCYPGSFAGTL